SHPSTPLTPLPNSQAPSKAAPKAASSSSSSSSSSDSSDEDTPAPVIAAPVPIKKSKKSKKEPTPPLPVVVASSSSDSSDDSSDSEDEKVTKKVVVAVKKTSTSSSDDSSESSSESSATDSSEDSTDDEEVILPAPVVAPVVVVKEKKEKKSKKVVEVVPTPTAAADSSSDSSDSSDSEDEKKTVPTVPVATTPIASKKRKADTSSDSSSSNSSSSDSDSDSPSAPVVAKVSKKQKTAPVESAVPSTPLATVIATTISSSTITTTETVAAPSPYASGYDSPNAGSGYDTPNGGKKARVTNAPFRRVKVEDAVFHDQRLMDNSFAARPAGMSDYGAKASADLIVTRGKGFTKEKNKKKRLTRGLARRTSEGTGAVRRDAVKSEDGHSNDNKDFIFALPKATFPSLPTEIKARVVLFAQAQDREFEEYLKSACETELTIIERIKTSWHGRSLVALSEVDQHLRMLCAKHLFAVCPTLVPLHRSRQARQNYGATSSPSIKSTFASSRLPLPSNSPKELSLYFRIFRASRKFKSTVTSDEVFGDLSSLNDNGSVNLSDEDSDSAENDDDSEDEEDFVETAQELRRAVLRGAIGKVQRLHLDQPNPAEVRAMVRTMPCLRSLSLVSLRSNRCFAPMFASAVALAPTIQHLTLDTFGFEFDWASKTAILPTLTSLTLLRVAPDHHTFKFIDSFSQTLTSLTLHFKTSKPSEALVIPAFKTSLPFLTDLNLQRTDVATATVILASLASPWVPSTCALRTIELQIVCPVPLSNGSSPLKGVLDPFRHTLRSLRIFDYRSLGPVSGLGRPKVHQRCELYTGVPADRFFDRMSIKGAIKQKEENDGRPHRRRVRDRTAVLRETLQFGLRYIDAMESSEDLEGLEPAFDALRELRVMRKLGTRL
ncbi:hypothetical protein P7C70_g7831, partial [Phenoliferia sp. Uapishka_3]